VPFSKQVFDTPRPTPAIDLQHLRFAVVAADHGSFRRAAELLSVRQSTLSRSVRLFEHLVGFALFERSSGGIKPTSAGKGVLRKARTIVEEFDSLIATARANQVGAAGRLAIGFSTSLSVGNLRSTLLDFKERSPQVELATAEKPRTQLLRMLRNGSLDVVILTGEITSLANCKSWPLWSERILATLAQEHPLASRDVLYWTDLRCETVLLNQSDPGPEIENLLNSKLVLASDRPKIERHDVSRGAIKALVSMKMGLSLVLESDLGAILPNPVYRELRDGSGPTRIGLSAFWQADNENPVLVSFLKLLRQRYPSPTPDL
jgi:DNA-binding transcriptional LysR family regulator